MGRKNTQKKCGTLTQVVPTRRLWTYKKCETVLFILKNKDMENQAEGVERNRQARCWKKKNPQNADSGVLFLTGKFTSFQKLISRRVY
ncbi:hypothetical protein ACUN8C_04360 [Kushneria sp. Sum13]|uniref:hypothetical protein n=1 Tax=Kushneria sp. Sum13 TaxID=3459196 RepID=UPI004045679F